MQRISKFLRTRAGRALTLVGVLPIVVFTSFVIISCAPARLTTEADTGGKSVQPGSPFISVEGARLVRQGKTYRFVGTNYWYGAYLGVTEAGRVRLRLELDQLKALGIDNLRVLAVAEQTNLTRAVQPAAHLSPGRYNEELLIGLDILLAEMAKRDMVAVLYLNNFWQWSGGMAQYMSWLSGAPTLDPDVTDDWNGFMQHSATFYRSAQAQNWYRELIRTLVTRTNSVTGLPYVKDPAIMSWQLANEPRPGSDAGGRPVYPAYKTWIQETARFIKSLDSNHLVSTGSEGSMGTLRDLNLYKDAHSIFEVDYLTIHIWPKNWSWFDINRSEQTYAEAVAKTKLYILQHIEVAKELRKPLVLEEFGIERDGGNYTPGTTTHERDRFFRELFCFVEAQVRLNTPFMGTNFWSWGGLGRAQSANFQWRTGDPFTGDPPQEPQGLNSVFSHDEATLKLLKSHSDILRDEPVNVDDK